MSAGVRKLRRLEEENARLRLLVADLSLEQKMLPEAIQALRPAQVRASLYLPRTCNRLCNEAAGTW
jgi:hypothetical protein